MTRLHCLIVEERSTSALSLKAALSSCGFSTFGFAATGPQAIAAARTRRPDLIITSTELRSFITEIEEAPVIYLSDDEIASEGEELVLQRPVGRAALFRAWEQVRGEAASAA